MAASVGLPPRTMRQETTQLINKTTELDGPEREEPQGHQGRKTLGRRWNRSVRQGSEVGPEGKAAGKTTVGPTHRHVATRAWSAQETGGETGIKYRPVARPRATGFTGQPDQAAKEAP